MGGRGLCAFFCPQDAQHFLVALQGMLRCRLARFQTVLSFPTCACARACAAAPHQVVLSEVVGVLKMRAFLSGMPECKLGLNDKVGRGAWASAVPTL